MRHSFEDPPVGYSPPLRDYAVSFLPQRALREGIPASVTLWPDTNEDDGAELSILFVPYDKAVILRCVIDNYGERRMSGSLVQVLRKCTIDIKTARISDAERTVVYPVIPEVSDYRRPPLCRPDELAVRNSWDSFNLSDEHYFTGLFASLNGQATSLDA